MSDSSDDESGAKWVPYSQREDWADITPMPQDDSEHPIVAIAYSAKFLEVFDYFRAILAKQEKSVRALDLTTDALRLNPANYTVWQYRRDILRELDSDLYAEMDYIADVIRDNAKNYQVWHHRRVIVEMLNDASKELELTQFALQTDAKNYHAWQHRQWVIRTYNLFDDELMFVDRLIAEDIRNNSAWNQRFFVLKHHGFTREVIQRELHYTMNRIRVVKNNESAWNYLVGILKQSKQPYVNAEGVGSLDQYPEVLEFSEELYNNNVRSPYLLAFLIDWQQEKCLLCNNTAEREVLARKVYTLCDEMAKKHDVIRSKYWQYVAEQLKEKLNDEPL